MGILANLRQAVLSSCTIDLGMASNAREIVENEGLRRDGFDRTMLEISFRISLIAIRSRIELDSAMYSASIVLKAICVCILEDHNRGHPIKVIR